MNRLKDVKKNITLSLGEGGDILFIVPPFTSNKSPAPGPHILRDIAREKGYKADVLYLNMLLASIVGAEFAESLGAPRSYHYWGMVTERLFARSAYSLPPLGKSPELCLNQALSISGDGEMPERDYDDDENLDLDRLRKMEEICKSFVDEALQAIVEFNYTIIGCTNHMGQTNCGIALINGIKRIRPEVITIMGGTNCQGEMAEGIASLSDTIDFVFSGESEYSFNRFLDCCSAGRLPAERIIAGKPLVDLQALPLMNYDNYFSQLKSFLGEEAPREIGLWYETSRGCWWAQKSKCGFCGTDRQYLKYRQKSANKVLDELHILGKRHPGAAVVMTDAIMPFSFLKDLLPSLAEKKDYPAVHFYNVKANLGLKDLINMKKAKINRITPGIESFSTEFLEQMNKGVTASDNLQLLRNARALGIDLHWFLLWGIPGDKRAYYEELLKILPLIRHLQPPGKFLCIFLERFSSYFENPGDYQIKNVRPWEVYRMIYPEWADIYKLAYYFTGDYPSVFREHPEIIRKINREVGIWQKTWKHAALFMVPFADFFVVHDRRGPGKDKNHLLQYSRAKEIMTQCIYNESEDQKWALQQKLGVLVDSRYVPLVTASPELLLEFES